MAKSTRIYKDTYRQHKYARVTDGVGGNSVKYLQDCAETDGLTDIAHLVPFQCRDEKVHLCVPRERERERFRNFKSVGRRCSCRTPLTCSASAALKKNAEHN